MQIQSIDKENRVLGRETPSSHYHWLDWLRFLAALMVVIGHTRFEHFTYYQYLYIQNKGLWSEALFLIPRFANEAVTVFFVLSGYLVGGKTLERAMNGKFDGFSYAIDRATRIWLPLIPCVIFTLAVTAIRGEKVNWTEGIGNILALQGVFCEAMLNNGSLWSLSYEIWFYIAALGFGTLMTRKAGTNPLFSIILLILVFAVFIKLNVTYLFVWAIGSLAFFYKPSRGHWYLFFLGLLLAICGALLSETKSEIKSFVCNFTISFIDRDYCRIMLAVGISLMLSVLVQLRPNTSELAIIESWGTKLAAWSYSLYLIHRPVLRLWSHWFGFQSYNQISSVSIVMYFVKVLSCLVAGWLFWLFFERHTDQLRRFLKRSLR
jgi:peptidoglycan/LPS O-acetylase OafA/YrhL